MYNVPNNQINLKPCGAFLISFIMSLLNYFKDTRSEMKHVSWPTRKQVINFTLLVLLICILTGIFLGLFDFLFTTGLKALILK